MTISQERKINPNITVEDDRTGLSIPNLIDESLFIEVNQKLFDGISI